MSTDNRFMQHALRLAARGLGTTAPNPAVGCVIVQDGQVVGRGWTQQGGRPHAEAVALAQAGARAQGATVYVTLEPCAHHGQTPPCAWALVQAGIARCVVACGDPDSRVAGKGLASLRKAGIQVTSGLLGPEARALNQGFFRRLEHGLPEITVKIATSLDGKLAWPDNRPRWITGEEARRYGHQLRAQHDAIVTGIGTVLADDPSLTCRLAGLESRSPIRVVLDSMLRLPDEAALIDTQSVPSWVVTSIRAPAEKRQRLEAKGVKVITLETEKIDFVAAMRALAKEGINRVLIEGGAAVTASALESALASALYWFRAPVVIGEKGKSAFEAAPPSPLPLSSYKIRMLGQDRLEIFRLASM